MIVICEDCGRKYRIDPAKIKGKTAKFKCKSCNHVITVVKPQPKPAEPEPPPFIEADGEVEATAAVGDESPSQTAAPAKKRFRIPFSMESGRIGLRLKMMVLFCVLPIVLFSLSGWIFLRQMDSLANLLTSESSSFARKMAEAKMADIARSTAMQVKLYLLSKPGLAKRGFDKNPAFKRVAVQKVGMTGYTALYELPGSDGVWRTWAHPNSKIIGINMKKLKKVLKQSFPGFWRVYTGVKKGGEAKGYYTWRDADGRFRDKFMVCTPVAGTRYIIAATTYLDEFTRDLNKLYDRSAELTRTARNTTWIILAVTLLIVGAVVSIYGHFLTRRMKALTDVADRISVGELDAQVPATSKDEIGDLAEAIARMQDSIRLSIERLRRRR